MGAADAILPQRIVRISDLLTTQVLITAGAIGFLIADRPGRYGVLAGLGVAVLCVVPLRGSSLPRWMAVRLRFWRERRRRQKKPAPPRPEPCEGELPEGSPIGFRWDGHRLLAVLRIEPDIHAMTVMDPATTVSGATLPLRALADGLGQFDITVDSIDVIAVGSRSRGPGRASAIYEAVLGTLPAVAHRSTCVAVRLDPRQCAEAVARRGGGWEGALRTAATATQRVANRLAGAGLKTRILTSAELDTVTATLPDGVRLELLEENWSNCQVGRLHLRTYALGPDLLTNAGLASLWAVRSHTTTVCLSLRNLQRDGALAVRGLVRFSSRGSARVRIPELIDLPGRQYTALLHTLPVPDVGRSLPGWVFGRSGDAVEHLTLPVAGCGQVIGADEGGRAVALPLFGRDVGRVDMRLPLHLAQQMVLRALAVGARIRVHTRREAAWRGMREQVADANYLTLTDPDSPQHENISGGTPTVELFDGITEWSVPPGVTTMSVRDPDAAPLRDTDVTLQLLDPDRDVVRVATPAGTTVVTMVATDEELRYLEPSLELAIR